MRGWKIVSVLAGMTLITVHSLWAQAFIDVNLALPTGACDLDWDQNGITDGAFTASTWGASGWQAALGAEASLDAHRKFGGSFSQRIQFSRSSGEAGDFMLGFHLVRGAVGLPLKNGNRC
jgi:hypothetical protein